MTIPSETWAEMGKGLFCQPGVGNGKMRGFLMFQEFAFQVPLDRTLSCVCVLVEPCILNRIVITIFPHLPLLL